MVGKLTGPILGMSLANQAHLKNRPPSKLSLETDWYPPILKATLAYGRALLLLIDSVLF